MTATTTTRLNSWIGRIDELRRLFNRNTGVVSPREEPRLRAAYKRLKEDLRAEHQALVTSDDALTRAERMWYARPVHKASVHLRARTNGALPKVLESLVEAKSDFELAISRMEDAAR